MAQHEAAQREILRKVRAGRRTVAAIETLANTLEGLKADQRFMLAAAHRDAPIRQFDITGKNGLIQQLEHTLRSHDTGAVFREQGMILQEAHHIRLTDKPAGGVSFQRFLEHGCNWLVAFQHLAATRHPLEDIARRCLEYPVAVHDTGHHTVLGLLAILLPMMLGDAGKKVLDQNGVGIFAEFDRRRFQSAAGFGDRAAKLQMRLKTAG